MMTELVAQPDARDCIPATPKKILIVDDDPSQVAALQHRLRKLGYLPMAAHDGQTALSLAFRDRPHLILLDLCLPDMEGGDVCAQLADAPETCGTPVIIISGLDRPDIIRHSRSVGGDFFLRKPYDPNVLLTLIERTLAGDEWL